MELRRNGLENRCWLINAPGLSTRMAQMSGFGRRIAAAKLWLPYFVNRT
jgi:hypothetical protein